MNIHNIRLGFATNSSSTHSIIFFKGKKGASDSDVEGEGFGWDFWTAASGEAKQKYLGQILKSELTHYMPDEVALIVCKDWLGVDVDPEGYVDHQSVWMLPRDWEGKMIDKSFVKDLSAFLQRPDVVLLGGNDNTEESHPLGDGAFQLPIQREGRSTSVARKDSRGFWTVFNRDNGTKVRFGFESPNESLSPKKADAPELVDLKLTDRCPYGCTYCYQGSLPTGRESVKDYVNGVIYALKDMKVFELAIGGGEPTLSPIFREVLSSCRYSGIVPNFTTRNLNWFLNKQNRDLFLASCGAFAYSIDKAEQIDELDKLIESWDDVKGYDFKQTKAAVQYVVGVGRDFELESVLYRAHERGVTVTLLGYKTNGRGKDVTPHEFDWVKSLERMNKEHKLPYRLGIDTALAKSAGKRLKEAGVSERLYTTEEGKFSCYIDAVAKKMGPSSYCDEKEMVPLEQPTSDNIRKVFASF